MAIDPVTNVTLAIILGTLVAIIYSLRILVLLERRIARMDHHVELMTMSILKDERRLLADEKKLENLIKQALATKKKPARKASSKKASSKKSSSKKTAKKTAKKSAAKKSSTKKSSKKTKK